MGEVVSLPSPERQIWCCACGCTTHYVYADGAQKCASCGSERPRGEWRDEPEMVSTPDDATVVLKGEPADFSLASILRDARRPDVDGIVLIFDSGRVRSRCKHPETDEQREWWKRRAQDFLEHLGIK